MDWEVELEVMEGQLLSVEPRFRGRDFLSPQAGASEPMTYNSWACAGHCVRFTTRTWGNPNIVTPATQGVCLEIAAAPEARIRGRVNGQRVDMAVRDLLGQSRAGYTGGFRAPAYRFHRAVPRSEYTCRFALVHESKGRGRDWYYVRVCQKNGQWAWSSPIWIDGE